MSKQNDLSSPHAPPSWQGNTYSLPRTRRLYYYGVAVFFSLLAASLISASLLILLYTFVVSPPMYAASLSTFHPVAQIGSSLAAFLIGFLFLKYAADLYLVAARTTLLIAPAGFIYTSNGGSMWGSWDNTVRIERLFIHNGWHEGILLRLPANIAGRTLGFSIFSIWVLPWDRFIPLTPFGELWRMPLPNRKAIEEFMFIARKLLPAHSIPAASPKEGALYHDIHQHAEHLFASES